MDGSRLQRPEDVVRVSFICRSNYEEMKAEGIEIDSSTFRKFRILPERVFPSIE